MLYYKEYILYEIEETKMINIDKLLEFIQMFFGILNMYRFDDVLYDIINLNK